MKKLLNVTYLMPTLLGLFILLPAFSQNTNTEETVNDLIGKAEDLSLIHI